MFYTEDYKDFDYPQSNHIFLQESYYGSHNFNIRLKDSEGSTHYFYQPKDRALKKFLAMGYKYKHPKINKINYDYFFQQVGFDKFYKFADEMKEYSFFINIDTFKVLNINPNLREIRDKIISLDNLIVFGKNLDTSFLESLGIEPLDYFTENDLLLQDAINLRVIYKRNLENNSNSEEVIKKMSKLFKIRTKILKAIINNEILVDNLVHIDFIKNGSSLNQEEKDFLQKYFIEKNVTTSLQDLIEDKEMCYTYLNHDLIKIFGYEMNKELLMEQIEIYTKREAK